MWATLFYYSPKQSNNNNVAENIFHYLEMVKHALCNLCIKKKDIKTEIRNHLEIQEKGNVLF